jgi:hypothetical protein
MKRRRPRPVGREREMKRVRERLERRLGRHRESGGAGRSERRKTTYLG